MVTGELTGKNIKITFDVYDKLVDLKRGKMTFSDVIESMLKYDNYYEDHK